MYKCIEGRVAALSTDSFCIRQMGPVGQGSHGPWVKGSHGLGVKGQVLGAGVLGAGAPGSMGAGVPRARALGQGLPMVAPRSCLEWDPGEHRFGT